MELIILIPAIVCTIVLARGSMRQALVWVYIPVLLLLPHYFSLRFPHMPPLTFTDMAILPLAVALAMTELRHWRLSWIDLFVVLFALSQAFSEGLNTYIPGSQVSSVGGSVFQLPFDFANGGLTLFAALTSVVLPYMVAKMLMEQGKGAEPPARTPVIRAMTALLAFVGIASVVDFVLKMSIWQRFWGHFFPGQIVEWPLQERWGFGRITGAYAHAILAGMVFLAGLIYCMWLRQGDPAWGARRLVKGIPVTMRGLTLAAIVLGLGMTQSRGPWAGAGLAVVFALLVHWFSVRKAFVLFVLLMSVAGVAAYYYGKAYTAGEISQATSLEQEDAIYRKQLLRSYLPLVAKRMAFGYGVTNLPTINGQKSIDNEFLWLAATQGLTGLGLFLAIGVGSGLRLIWLALKPIGRDDQTMLFAHLAVLMGLLATLTTVYLGETMFVLFFFLAGWMDGMNPARVTVRRSVGFTSQYRFQKVLV